MDKSEFIKRLEENKFFKSPKDLVEYRLPVLQYYLHNLAPSMMVNGHVVNFANIDIIYKDEDFTLVNQAFLSLVKRLNEFK